MMKSVETVSREPITNLTEADALLDECSFALQFGHRFQRFVEGALGEDETVTAALLKSLQTLEGLYIRLEDAYRDAGVREALEDMDDPLAALQDAFFVLRRGVDRAVGTLYRSRPRSRNYTGRWRPWPWTRTCSRQPLRSRREAKRRSCRS